MGQKQVRAARREAEANAQDNVRQDVSPMQIMEPLFGRDFYAGTVKAMQKVKDLKGGLAESIKRTCWEAGKGLPSPEQAVLACIEAHKERVLQEYRARHPKADHTAKIKQAMQEATGTGSAYQYLSYVAAILSSDKEGLGFNALSPDNKLALPKLYAKARRGEEGAGDGEGAGPQPVDHVREALASVTQALQGLPEDEAVGILADTLNRIIERKAKVGEALGALREEVEARQVA